tara:strand:- start:237 stop:452 length:216 start_codon:yes stop_codon:yes gene_type:complete
VNGVTPITMMMKNNTNIKTKLLLLIFLALASCGTIEYAYSEASWVAHQIHFQENMDMPNCQWCIEYNKMIP